ncbi:MAG TPA: NUDIX domain-containing protein [Candidatus Limnocylindria bacterium]
MTELEEEIALIAARFGEPRRVDALIRPFFDPIQRPDRFAEVCMVIRRRNGKVPLSIKTFYPRGAYRLPTGGIHHGERILDALRRETEEETGLETVTERFLAWITYRPVSAPDAPPLFHTFAFLLDEVGGRFHTRDLEEQIEEWFEVEPAALGDVADRLDRITSAPSHEIGGDWADWGHFRAVVHRVVHEELMG